MQEQIASMVHNIESEIALCEREIQNCRKQRAVAEEREHCYDDRKTMLLDFLEKVNDMYKILIYDSERRPVTIDMDMIRNEEKLHNK
ncbi:MAG: hypothetical protein ACI4JN_06465 [Ruminococcus sp.]